MLSKFANFVKTHQADIILAVGVIFISLLSFAMGYIAAKTQEKTPLKIEMQEGQIFGLLTKFIKYDILLK